MRMYNRLNLSKLACALPMGCVALACCNDLSERRPRSPPLVVVQHTACTLLSDAVLRCRGDGWWDNSECRICVCWRKDLFLRPPQAEHGSCRAAAWQSQLPANSYGTILSVPYNQHFQQVANFRSCIVSYELLITDNT